MVTVYSGAEAGVNATPFPGGMEPLARAFEGPSSGQAGPNSVTD